MSYQISVKEDLNKEYHGCDCIYTIKFQFNKHFANLVVEFENDKPTICRIDSETDGYHWLQFWLSQEPGTNRLNETDDFNTQIEKCNRAFNKQHIEYKQEGKSTAYLSYMKCGRMEIVTIIAEIVEPRFALREKFFPEPQKHV